MTIAVGDRVPEVKVFTFGERGPEATTSTDVLGHGKVVLFGVPGAFSRPPAPTTTCLASCCVPRICAPRASTRWSVCRSTTRS